LDWTIDHRPADPVRSWKASLLKEYKPGTVNAWLSGVKCFYKWLVKERYMDHDPAAEISGIGHLSAKTRHVRQSLTDEEMIRLFNAPDRTTDIGKRDYAMILLLSYTATRGISVNRADISDLGSERDKPVLYAQGKGHFEKDQPLVLVPQLDEAIKDWLSVRGDKPGALFTSLSHRDFGARLSRRSIHTAVKTNMKKAGIFGKNKTTHSLRHTAITSAMTHGVSIQKVMGMSGHSDPKTLMIYAHEIDRIDNPAEESIDYGG
jgi:site-specific recombinase XerD